MSDTNKIVGKNVVLSVRPSATMRVYPIVISDADGKPLAWVEYVDGKFVGFGEMDAKAEEVVVKWAALSNTAGMAERMRLQLQVDGLQDELRAANAGREGAAEAYRAQVAEMRAKLDEAERQLDVVLSRPDAAADHYRRMQADTYQRQLAAESDRDRLAAQVESLTRERDQHAADKVAIRDVLVGHGHGSSIGEATKDAVAGVCRRLTTAEDQRDKALVDLAVMKERAEKALGEVEEFRKICHQYGDDMMAIRKATGSAYSVPLLEAVKSLREKSLAANRDLAREQERTESARGERAAARAEADALRAEVEKLAVLLVSAVLFAERSAKECQALINPAATLMRDISAALAEVEK